MTHDIPIRFLANALTGDDPLDGPVTAVANASVLVVAEADLAARDLDVMRQRVPPRRPRELPCAGSPRSGASRAYKKKEDQWLRVS